MKEPTLPSGKSERKRVNLSLPPELNEQLVALAAVEGKKPAKFAREILADYFSKRADEIAEAQRAGATYQKTINDIRRASTPA